MKAKIHPQLNEVEVVCACGERFKSLSTQKGIKVEVCSKCHPFFTGKQKFLDTAGRVERFRQKFGKVVPRRKKKGGGEEEPKRQKIDAKG